VKVPIESLQTFCISALEQVGLGAEDAQTTAHALVTTDAMGIFTHGTKLLSGYLHRLRGGGYRAAGMPRIEREGPAWAVVDGDSALGQVGSMFAMRTAIRKAQQAGMAYVALHDTGHIGAAGYYAALAAQAGLIGYVVGNDMPSVAAPGSREAVLGSNPMAYGIPVPGRDPILLDMATSAVAGGKVYAAHQRGEPLPNTWIIDRQGRPTTDGSLYPHQAALAPMAGHKGYGLALWAEVLSAVLPGGPMTWQVGSWIFDPPDKPSRHNAAFLAIDVAAITPPEEFAKRIQALVDEIHAAPAAEGVDRVLVPGEREWNLHRQAMEEGITLPEDVIAKLRVVAADSGLEPEWLGV
jgi:ureidoglycolate dehydrogenase (NAD+)